MQPHIFILSNIFFCYLEIFGIHEASALCVEQTKKETTYYSLKKIKRRLWYPPVYIQVVPVPYRT